MNLDYFVPIINFVRDVLFGDLSEEEDEHEVIEKIENFGEITVIHMSSQQFKIHFRMFPETFEDLLRKMYNANEEIRRYPRSKIPIEKEVMITIWYLGNIESFR